MLFMGESVTEHPLRESPASTISTWSGSAREQAVQRMFTSIAGVYDLNNTLLSFGLHYRWKKMTAADVPCVKDGTALDVGAGTADLALFVESRMGAHGRVIASDLNHAMLAEGLKKIGEKGLSGKITCLQANAEHLGFDDNTFDAVTTGFCMRNVGNLDSAWPARIIVKASACEGADALAGYSLQQSADLLTFTRLRDGRLPAGGQRAIGWARCANIDQGGSHVDP